MRSEGQQYYCESGCATFAPQLYCEEFAKHWFKAHRLVMNDVNVQAVVETHVRSEFLHAATSADSLLQALAVPRFIIDSTSVLLTCVP